MNNFIKIYSRYGITGLAKVIATRFYDFVVCLNPSAQKAKMEGESARLKRCEEFDQQYGVETLGYVHHTDLSTGSQNQNFAASYFGSDPVYVRRAIEQLQVDYGDFTFIDFGSGKGRVILIASEYPFNEIIGVEFSHELHKIAAKNLANFNRSRVRCEAIASVCIDATEFTIPKGALVLFFFNPFTSRIMEMVFNNIEKSFLHNPRQIYIIYANPEQAKILDRSKFFERYISFGPVVIWRSLSAFKS